MSSTPEIRQLLIQSLRSGSKTEQAKLIDRAIQLADAGNLDNLSWSLRTQILQPATFSGQIDLLLVHFAKALAMSDKDPEEHPIENLLWAYKWAIDAAPYFPHVPLNKIHALVDDFARRMKERGEGEQVSEYMRLRVAVLTGDFAAARKALAAYEELKGDRWSDCDACEANSIAEFHAILHEDEQAFESAAEIFAGHIKCAEVPTLTYGSLQLPALRLGRPEVAAKQFLKGYPHAEKEEKMTRTCGEHLQMLALTHNTVRGLEVLSRIYPRVADTPQVLERVYFWLGADLLMHRLADRKTVKVSLPESFEGYQPSGEYAVADLLNHFKNKVDTLAKQFDQRNGNAWLSDHAKHVRSLLNRVGPHEIKAPAPRKPRAPRKPIVEE